jgi:Icc-related predicted phosphoesterase
MPMGTNASMRLVLISDTHELEAELVVPRGDLLICAGDITFFSGTIAAVRAFNTWLGSLPHRHKIVVPGNHDGFLEMGGNRSLLSNAVVLIDEAIEVEGLKIWGSPVTPLQGTAFGISSREERRRLFAGIPLGTDILVTHGPPFGILDCQRGSTVHAGCPELLDAVMRIKPRLHVYGHIHGAYGLREANGITFANVALLGANGELEHDPMVLEMKRQNR